MIEPNFPGLITITVPNIPSILTAANKDCQQFFDDSLKAIQTLITPGFPEATATLKKELANLDDFVNGYSLSAAQNNAIAAKISRDNAFKELRNCAKQWNASEEGNKQALGRVIWRHLRNFSNFDHISSEELASRIPKALSLIREDMAKETYKDLYRGSEIEALYQKTMAAEVEYITASQELHKVQEERKKHTNRELRENCANILYMIMSNAQNLAVQGKYEDCNHFADVIKPLQEKYMPCGLLKETTLTAIAA